jgi:hypothetical protein
MAGICAFETFERPSRIDVKRSFNTPSAHSLGPSIRRVALVVRFFDLSVDILLDRIDCEAGRHLTRHLPLRHSRLAHVLDYPLAPLQEILIIALRACAISADSEPWIESKASLDFGSRFIEST